MTYFVRNNGLSKGKPLSVSVGQTVMTTTYNLYEICEERFIRTGQFNAGYREYFVKWLNAPPDRRASGWISEYTITDDNFAMTH